MVITKAIETEITRFMENYWSTYFQGEVETWSTYLADDYKNIGGNEEEVWNSKTEIMDYTMKVIDQMRGTAQLRNKQIEVFSLTPYVLAHEFVDIYIKVDNEWAFYGKFRLSTILQKSEDSWKVIHQHGSYPDSKTDQGEAFAFNKISTENRELKDAIKRRTIELEQTNRELQIEACLERVRTVAMGMNQPTDMLDVCRVISTELQSLNVENIRNIQTAIFYEPKGIYLNYEYFPLYDKPVITEVEYNLQPDVKAFVNQMLQDPEAFFTTSFEGEKLSDWITYQKNSNQFADPMLEKTASLHYYFYSIGPGALGISTYSGLSDENIRVFKRFRNVFELAYRRFIDIEQAIAQAREAQIELGLERVRARAMAMQRSGELKELIGTVFTELTKLDLVLTRCLIMIFDPNTNGSTWWMANSEDASRPTGLLVQYHDLPPYVAYIQGWKQREFKWGYILEGADKKGWDDFIFADTELSGLPDFVIAGMRSPDRVYLSASFNNFGCLNLASLAPLSVEHTEILLRFAKVFDLTYTRFNDLQNAEAQVREAKVEAALERTRTQSMIMQHSNELDDTLRVFHQQVLSLGINSAFSFLWLPDEKNDRHIFWAAWSEDLPAGQEDKSVATVFKSKAIDYPLDRNEPATAQCLVDWKSDQPVFSYYVKPAEVDEYFATWKELLDGVEKLEPTHFSGGLHYVEAFMKFGCFGVMVTADLADDEKKLLSRFAIEFERTYTRFLDLQKAEAQAREGQVQLALERVRARTMAMQHSSEMAETASVLFGQIKQLGFETWSCGFCIWREDDFVEAWMGADSGGLLPPMRLPYKEEKTHLEIYKAYLNGDPSHERVWEGQDLVHHYQYMQSIPSIKKAFEVLKEAGLSLPTLQCYYTGFFEYGYLMLITLERNAELKELSVRFARVFEQTYTRFLDLQKAEEQARESQTEAALERVRSRTMAMQRSDELQDTALLLVQQVKALGVPSFACGFNIWDEDRKAATAWMAGEDRIQPPFKTSSSEDIFLNIHEAAQKGEQLFVLEQGGEELVTHYRYMASLPPFKAVMDKMAEAGLSVPTFQVIHCAFFSQGYLMFISFEPVPAAHEIFKRFAKVFEQTYTRFLDLQNAEAQARESQIQLALERVRARTMAMQQSEELSGVASLVFHQMNSLGIPCYSSGFTIWDNGTNELISWMCNADGSMNPPFIIPIDGEPWHRRQYESWKNGEDFIVNDMAGEEMKAHFHYLRSFPLLNEAFKKSITAGHPMPDRQVHHAANFTYGNLLFITLQPVPHAHDIFKRFAKVFEQTYTRFLDLKKAEAQAIEANMHLLQIEAEKNRAEAALTELKDAQAQLIQAEKMASLGELTAGIAHEIQNPLNFVNNFSEVSSELLDEMNEELNKGDIEEAKIISSDIKQNLEKINHHGKRADAIVKGMLQHSRSSNGVKEPTNINALADEYLRLAYHGLRAKDNSFNATLKTEFDNSLGTINIIPQDIGRVILNLITNAFYAVAEKKNDNSSDYDPTVTVRTQALELPSGGSGVLVAVADNGNGIPPKVLDKIFQPFFTTKPTGQGTGLGLSMSYDIVKAHGGDLQVETKENEGTEFIISIPN